MTSSLFHSCCRLGGKYTVTQRSPKSEEEQYRLFWLCKGVSIGTVTVLASFQHYSPAHIDLQCTVYSDKYSDVKASVHQFIQK